MKNNLGKNIERRLEQLGKTQVLVAEESGMSTVMLHKLITGKAKSTGKLVALAKALQCTSEQLVTGKFENDAPSDNFSGPVETRKVPVISWITAGELCDSSAQLPDGAALEWIDCPFSHSDEAFCLIVEGLSMYPEYRDGEYILVEPGIQPEHGDDVIVRTPDGRQTFKQYQSSPEGPYLVARNPEFPNRIIPVPEGTRICGVVTGSWIRRRKKR